MHHLVFLCSPQPAFAAIILQLSSSTAHPPCPRRQGSVHLPLWRRLAQQAAAGRLAVLEGFEVADAAQQNSGCAGSTSWVLTLKRSELVAEAAGKSGGPSLFQQAVAAAQAASAAAGTAQTPTTPGEPAQPPAGDLAPQQQQPAERQQQQLLQADEVWLACGSAYNAAVDPVFADLARQAPAPLAGGYPWLDDESLCWPGAPVFLLGRGAMCSVGPSAGERGGCRAVGCLNAMRRWLCLHAA